MTLVEELFQLADDASDALARRRDENLKKPLSGLSRACDQAKRAWSGSNLGYHATVYYEGLEPKPAWVEFSPEWGMKDPWPTHQPDPGWHQMEHQAVIDEILARADNPDIEVIEKVLAQLRDRFSSLKERAISLLTAIRRNTHDAFLDRKLEQVEPLKITDSRTIALTLIRRQEWSRDSLAVTQGSRVAPHQSLIAIPLSATVIENGLNTLEKVSRESPLHLERIDQGQRKLTATGKSVFIGHGQSPVWRELKEFLEDRLHLSVDEFNSIPVAGIATAVRLEEMLGSAAFSFLIMTAEDEQSDGKFHARLNVVHEAGLFQGRLGFRKAIILLEDTCEEFSNIRGLGQLRFPKGSISAKFEEIRRVLEREGLITTL
jgi:predicted nucleotide-binding protein